MAIKLVVSSALITQASTFKTWMFYWCTHIGSRYVATARSVAARNARQWSMLSLKSSSEYERLRMASNRVAHKKNLRAVVVVAVILVKGRNEVVLAHEQLIWFLNTIVNSMRHSASLLPSMHICCHPMQSGVTLGRYAAVCLVRFIAIRDYAGPLLESIPTCKPTPRVWTGLAACAHAIK